MKKALLLVAALALFSPVNLPAAPGEPAEELARDMEGFQKSLDQVRRVIEERVQGMDRSNLEKARLKVMQLASDERFLKAAGDLWSHPNRNTLLIAELVFMVLMYFFKAWRQSRARNWFTKLMTGFFLSIITWFGIVLVLPAIILGEPFRTFVTTLWRVLWA